MDVAESHLSRVGYRGVSLLEVAREVGISKPSVYYHFPEGKEQLFVEISHRSLRRVREGMERVMSGGEDGAGKLRAAARWLMRESEEGHPLKELDDVSRFVDERHHAALAEGFHSACYQPVKREISTSIDSGEFQPADPDFLTWAFLGLLSGMLDVERANLGPLPTLAGDATGAADKTMDLFLDGVRA